MLVFIKEVFTVLGLEIHLLRVCAGDRFTVECRIDEEDDHVYPLPLSEDNLTVLELRIRKSETVC